MVIVSLIDNLALLIALSVFSGFVERRRREVWHGAVAQGLLFGGAAVVGMLHPVVFAPGLIFDGRSIMISLCGVFFGPLAVAIAGGMAAVCRIWMGGVGLSMGLAVITVSATVGLLFYQRQTKDGRDVATGSLWWIGVLVHILMVLCFFFLPYDLALNVVRQVAGPILLVYPVATVLVGKVLSDQRSHERVMAELQTERDNLQAVLHASPVAVMVLDREARIVMANPAAKHLFGRMQSTLEGHPCGDFLGCHNRLEAVKGCGYAPACPACVLRESVAEVFATEQGVYDRDAQYRLEIQEDVCAIRFSMEPVTLDGKRNVMVAMMDITSQKRAENALRESEQRYRILADSGQGLIWTTGTDRKADYFNNPWLTFTGRTLEQELGDGWLEAVHPDDRRQLVAVWHEAFDRRERFNIMYRLQRHDGVYRWIQDCGSPRYNTQGQFIGYIGHCLDVTENRETEASLRQIEWMLSKKPKQIPQEFACDSCGREALTSLNHGGAIIKSVSREMLAGIVDEYLDLLGTSSVIFEANGDYAFGLYDSGWCRLMDRASRRLCDTDDHAVALASGKWQCHENCWHGCAERVLETRAPVDTGCYAGLRLYGVPILIQERVIGVIVFSYGDPPRDAQRLQELSEHYQVSVDLLRRESESYNSRPPFIIEMAKDRLQVSAWLIASLVEARQSEEARDKMEMQFRQAQKMEAIGRLAGGVAHDFNNILQSLIGYSELLLEKIPEPGELREFATEIVSESKRAVELTRQLLTFARKQAVNPKVFELNAAVSSTMKMLSRLLGESIQLEWKPMRGPGFVKMDVGQFEQILANLVVNARDAIRDNGRVSLGTDKEVFDKELCDLNPDYVPGPYVVLSVADNGCGMDEATLEHLFEPFFTTKARGKGTGLGLATVYGFIKQSGGYITVYSAPGKGSVFKIYLPEHAAAEAVPDDGGEKEGVPQAGQGTVLLVDDEEPLLRAGRRMLEGLGYTVLVADNPDEALRQARTYPHDIHVLLTDVVMPVMSGPELWRKIEGLRPSIKCLYMSGFTSNIVAQRGDRTKNINFLQKPFSKTALASALQALLAIPTAGAESRPESAGGAEQTN